MRRQPRVAIIGGGPAGIAAAIQLKRSNISPILFEQKTIGGLLFNANRVENYPGFSKGVSGKALVKHLREHLRTWRPSIHMQRVRTITKERGVYNIKAQRTYTADIIIIASGTKAITPDITVNVTDHIHYDLSTLGKRRNKQIIIVGAGDAAYDYALNLGRYNKVLILNRGSHVRALPLLVERVKVYRSITMMDHVKVENIGYKCEKLYVIVSTRNKKSVITCDDLIFAIGREPALDFLCAGLLRKFPYGDRTLYFIGDVKNGDTRQVAIAVGDGVKAAMRIAQSAISCLR